MGHALTLLREYMMSLNGVEHCSNTVKQLNEEKVLNTNKNLQDY